MEYYTAIKKGKSIRKQVYIEGVRQSEINWTQKVKYLMISWEQKQNQEQAQSVYDECDHYNNTKCTNKLN